MVLLKAKELLSLSVIPSGPIAVKMETEKHYFIELQQGVLVVESRHKHLQLLEYWKIYGTTRETFDTLKDLRII